MSSPVVLIFCEYCVVYLNFLMFDAAFYQWCICCFVLYVLCTMWFVNMHLSALRTWHLFLRECLVALGGNSDVSYLVGPGKYLELELGVFSNDANNSIPFIPHHHRLSPCIHSFIDVCLLFVVCLLFIILSFGLFVFYRLHSVVVCVSVLWIDRLNDC